MQHCSSSCGRTNCVCILLMEICSSQRVLGSPSIQVPEVVSHMTSPLAWFGGRGVRLKENLRYYTTISFSAKSGFHTKREESGTHLVFSHGWSLWSLAVVLLNVCAWDSWSVLSGQTSVPVHTLPTHSQHRRGPMPSSLWSLCSLWGVVETQSTYGTDRIFIMFFKCQITTTWLDLKTLFSKVSWWPFTWRWLPALTAKDTILIDSPLCM